MNSSVLTLPNCIKMGTAGGEEEKVRKIHIMQHQM